MKAFEFRDELPVLRDLVTCALMAAEATHEARPIATLLDVIEERVRILIDGFDEVFGDLVEAGGER